MPVKGVAYAFALFLIDQTNRSSFKSSPTLATGDFKVDKDDAGFTNLATLPVVSPAATARVLVSLSATEMAADKVTVLAHDAAGGEWDDVAATIKTDDYANFEFVMYDSNGDPKAGETVTAQKSVNGGAYGAATNAVAAVSGGTYKIDLTPDIPSTGMVSFEFTSANAKTQTVSLSAEA